VARIDAKQRAVLTSAAARCCTNSSNIAWILGASDLPAKSLYFVRLGPRTTAWTHGSCLQADINSLRSGCWLPNSSVCEV
jgi:hypothetical protein